MIAKLYEIKVCEGTLALVHGATYTIEEICVLDLGVCVNGEQSFLLDEDSVQERVPENADEVELSEDDEQAFHDLHDALVKKQEAEERLREQFSL
jgi:hypothetical protein